MKKILYPLLRIVWHSAVAKTFQPLIGRCGGFQSIGRNRGCRLAPGESLLLDFGRGITGGVRILQGVVVPRLEEERAVAALFRFGESVTEAMTDPDNQHAIHDVHFCCPPWAELRSGRKKLNFRFLRE